MVSLKALNASLEERNHLNALRDIEVKTNLCTLDSRMELLNVKHENLEMTVCQKKVAQGKRSFACNKLESLYNLKPTVEKFGQASFDLKESLKGVKLALNMDARNSMF